MAGSEYYDDHMCPYCGLWHGVDEDHSCKEVTENLKRANDIRKLMDKINTSISYSRAVELYQFGFRAEDIIDVGFRLKAGWVSKYG